MKSQIEKILQILTKDLKERDEIIKISFLTALAGENIFLYGPPGVAKSLISRRISSAFESENYFEYLMQKFSTPEDVFGPISLSELKKDNYLRKTDGYLPKADFGFLDEIWKANPAILNTLLTIINEKIFKNSNQIEKVPLKVLFSASNETPPQNQGLEALYDRFLVRIFVEPIKQRDNFEYILQNGATNSDITIDKNLKISSKQWSEFKQKINNITISSDTFDVINSIRLDINEYNQKQPDEDIVYISDRRWQKAAYLLKASAFFSGRSVTNIADCFILEYCLWTTRQNHQDIKDIVYNSINTMGLNSGIDLIDIEKEITSIENALKTEITYSQDIYETVKINNKEYFTIDIEYGLNEEFKEEIEAIKNDIGRGRIIISKNDFLNQNNCQFVEDKFGRELDILKCKFENNICNMYLYDELNIGIVKPKILHKKGELKEHIDKKILKSYTQEIFELQKRLITALETITKKKHKFLENSSNPFLDTIKIDIVKDTIDKQIEDIELNIKNIQSIKSMIEEIINKPISPRPNSSNKAKQNNTSSRSNTKQNDIKKDNLSEVYGEIAKQFPPFLKALLEHTRKKYEIK